MKRFGSKNQGPTIWEIIVPDGPGPRITMIFAVLAVTAGIIAVIVVASSFPGEEESNNTTITNETDSIKQEDYSSRIWYFGYPNHYKPYSFTDGGKLRGLSLKIMDAVCREAGMNCKHLLIPSKLCYDRKTGHGEALQRNWVDACVGFYKTIERVNVFSAFAPLYLNVTSRMLAKTQLVQLKDRSDKKIGLIADDHADQECLFKVLNVSSNSFPEYRTVAQAIKDLEAGQIDALFLAKYNEAVLDLLKNSPFPSVQGMEELRCSIDGSGLLASQGSPVESWFPPALQKIKDSGAFERFCGEARTEYEKPVDCFFD